MTASDPFPLPGLNPSLERVRTHWRSLVRGANDMPFWDDFKPQALPQDRDRLMLLDVFDKPLRFRFSSVMGAGIQQRYGRALSDLFSDEVEAATPFEYLNAQAVATVEARKPTYYASAGYARLILPMWGDGRISMLLCAFDWRE